jgi:hypothetical protein
VRVEAAAPDDVAPRRRHVGPSEAGEQGAGQQERGADALGELAVDLGRADVGGAEPDLVVRAVDAHADVLEQAEHGVHVADPGDVGDHHLLLGQQRGGQDGQGGVLVAGGDDRSGQRRSAFDHELLHEACAGRPGWELGRLGRKPS